MVAGAAPLRSPLSAAAGLRSTHGASAEHSCGFGAALRPTVLGLALSSARRRKFSHGCPAAEAVARRAPRQGHREGTAVGRTAPQQHHHRLDGEAEREAVSKCSLPWPTPALGSEARSWDLYSDLTHSGGSDEILNLTLIRVIFPTVLSFIGGTLVYSPVCEVLQNLLDIGNTGSGPILNLLGMDQSQFMQNFLTVNGLLFTILCGNTYTALYSQQERLYHALFREVSEAKSLLEQACLVCQGRPFYPRVLQSIGEYVENDLRRLDAEPADLLANRPMDDPLEYILYATSVGVPSIIYDTIRDLRQARAQRLGAMQRKLPGIHFLLLYALGVLELLAFPLLGAGTASMFRERNVLIVQAIFFGAMCGAIVMTLQVMYELWKPFGGAYTVDVALGKMVLGLEEELRARRELWGRGAELVRVQPEDGMWGRPLDGHLGGARQDGAAACHGEEQIRA